MSVQIIIRATMMTHEREFRKLNSEWISKYFYLEDSDCIILENPQKYILYRGGNVFLHLIMER